MTFDYKDHSQRHAVKNAVDYLELIQNRAKRLVDDLECRKQDLLNFDNLSHATRSDYFNWAVNDVQGFLANIEISRAMRCEGALTLAFDKNYKPEI